MTLKAAAGEWPPRTVQTDFSASFDYLSKWLYSVLEINLDLSPPTPPPPLPPYHLLPFLSLLSFFLFFFLFVLLLLYFFIPSFIVTCSASSNAIQRRIECLSLSQLAVLCRLFSACVSHLLIRVSTQSVYVHRVYTDICTMQVFKRLEMLSVGLIVPD